MKFIPVDYLFPYIGGKKLLRPYIVPMIPDNIQTYVEPFFGGYKDYKQMTISRRCTLNNKAAKDFGELIVWNYEEPPSAQGVLF